MALSFNAITHPLPSGSSGGETLFHPFPSPKTSGERVIDVNWVTIKIQVLSCWRLSVFCMTDLVLSCFKYINICRGGEGSMERSVGVERAP